MLKCWHSISFTSIPLFSLAGLTLFTYRPLSICVSPGVRMSSSPAAPRLSLFLVAISLSLSSLFLAFARTRSAVHCVDALCCQMLMNLHREQWTQGLVMRRFEDHQASNEKTVEVRWGHDGQVFPRAS